jgi:hypothetical protein
MKRNTYTAYVHGLRTRLTYTAYSIGCAVVRAVVLIGVAVFAGSDKLHTVTLVFLGWRIGWLSATIARSVYPPPKSRP